MPIMPLTSEQIAEAVEVTSATIDHRLGSREKKWLDKAAKQLNEMLANPRFAFRSVETLATVFDDDPPYTLTRGTLKRLPGIRRSTLRASAWIKEDNWVWTVDENGRKRVAKDSEGRYILQENVPEGHI
jgi:hypothetical protein